MQARAVTYVSGMNPLYAALAEKERRLIWERTKAALAARNGQGAQLGNPRNVKQIEEADRFAASITPIVEAFAVPVPAVWRALLMR